MATRRTMPILQVAKVARSTEFYNRLGFATGGVWDLEGEPNFAIVQRGDVTIGLQLLRAATMPNNTHWAAYVYIDDAKELYEEFCAAGIAINRKPEEAPYGCIDFDVRDPDGHLIAFGQDLNPEPNGPGLGSQRGNG
ncbi:MAG: VOC family protein [Rhizobiaceae bacterium]